MHGCKERILVNVTQCMHKRGQTWNPESGILNYKTSNFKQLLVMHVIRLFKRWIRDSRLHHNSVMVSDFLGG